MKADKEEHLNIYLTIPQGMKIKYGTLRQYGVQDKSYLALQLKKSLYELGGPSVEQTATHQAGGGRIQTV